MKRVVKNGQRGSRQGYINKTKFDPNRHKHEKERLSDSVFLYMTSLCCQRCCEIIQWKVDFGKYVSLEHPRKCNTCMNKDVTIAYHRICQACAKGRAICAKCQKASKNTTPQPVCGDDFSKDSDYVPQENNPRKYKFVEEMSSYPQLEYLCGLDVRCLERELSIQQHNEKCNELRCLNERRRRTMLRQLGKQHECASDSDEEL